MRKLPTRPSIPKETSNRLARETKAIESNADPKSEADRRYARARRAKWFGPVIRALQTMAGPGERCMLCSGSEASDVEHFRPKAVFPDRAMTWENFLWTCAPCNRNKSNRFPPWTEPGGQLINPVEEDVWAFFFIDEFGLLTPLYDGATKSPDVRAVTTRDILKLNRDALQESRKSRRKDLVQQTRDLILKFQSGNLPKDEIRLQVDEWLSQPFQPDVADYFLRGPGRNEEPFQTLFAFL